jgi:hypothetical protein
VEFLPPWLKSKVRLCYANSKLQSKRKLLSSRGADLGKDLDVLKEK